MPSAFFTYTGGYQYWTVPAGVTSVTVACQGGGSVSNQAGRVSGKLAVTGGQRLVIICGGNGDAASGNNGGSNTWGGGGAGGDGNNAAGGDGGGGYSAIRLGTTTGTIKCVAGGAGGDSGDNGQGGEGGASTGGSGGRGTSGSNSTSNATGGTQSQGGNKGTSSSGSDFDGNNASDTVVGAYGGTGGSSTNHSHGGGGGGGGYHQGGGGQASSFGFAPGGGGGGGSNYTGGLTSATSTQGNGGVGGGDISLTWDTPAPANARPNTPSNAKINGAAESPDFTTKSTGSVTFSGTVSDPDGDDVLLMVRLSTTTTFATYIDTKSALGANNTTRTVVVNGLTQNVHYYGRLFAQDNHGAYSANFNAIDFWTNRKAVAVPTAPLENATVPGIGSTIFTWTYTDPDGVDPQTGFELQYRTQATLVQPAGAWTLISKPTVAAHTWTVDPGTFRGSTFYEWQVRVKDSQGLWGDFSPIQSFFVSSISAPPVPLYPVANEAVNVEAAQTFTWKFVDPDPGDAQTKADVRYRLVGQQDSDWVVLLGDITVPGANNGWPFSPETFVTGYNYEWQARTYDTIGASQSDWSQSGTFWTTGTPGSAVTGLPTDTSPLIKGSLGCGVWRAYVYFQGGMIELGEIEPLRDLTMTRVRDDISKALMHTNGRSTARDEFYGALHCWIHEVVLFRDGVREWEGPITRISYQGDQVEIEAQDVMVYAYRRILKQGYNDSYQLVNGQQLGLRSVVARAQQNLINAFAPYDPNVLPYLTAYQFPDDARQSRVVADYSRTVWEDVDDLAATAGLDYTTVGRRILLWDTHRAIGRLPELRDGDFADDPIITEYGMNLCNYSAVTNGSGVWGAATPQNLDPPTVQQINGGFNHILHPGGDPVIIQPGQPPAVDPRWWKIYGPIEMLASAYGEAAGGSDETLTPAARQALVSAMEDQAARNIGDRWPTPVIVRVPDNSMLNPEVGVTFDQLVPGVWLPVRSTQYMRTVAQWQKLDSVGVTVDKDGEKVSVVMSPAPNAGEDPDAAQAAEDES